MGELEQLQQAIAALDAQRAVLGDAVVEAALAPMREKLAVLQSAREPEQQRKLATVLFMDIAGHTSLTHHLDPEEQMEIIDRALAQMAVPVAQHGGRVVRFQGDGFKAVFGLPTAQENDPDNAIRTALAIQTVAREIAGRLEREHGLPGFTVRVGIATGLVLGGGGTEGEDTVKGEPVNLAARMESAAKPGTVLIAQNTYQHVRGAFDVQPLAPIQVKGFDDPVPIYQVLNEKSLSFRTRRRGVEGVQTRMVGRDREIGILQDLFSASVEGRRQFATIIGEPGLGKSRLLFELENWIHTQPVKVKIYRGRARLETQRIPYGLLRDLFFTALNIREDDSEAVAAQKLEQGVRKVAGAGEEDWAPFIGHIIGFHYSDDPRIMGILDDAQQIRDLAFNGAVQFFQSALRIQPALVFLEDIHWADEGSLDFIHQLASLSPTFPLLIVCLARNTLFEFRPSWGDGLDHLRIDLEPLSSSQSWELVSDILQRAPEIPPEIHEIIVSRAEGNPFYVEEVIKMLIDDGVILPGEDRWRVQKDKFIAGKIPATLTGVLQARLDGLPLQERKLLDRASVAGRVFWNDLLTRMKETPEAQEGNLQAEIKVVLGKLQGRELVYQHEQSTFSSTPEYVFKHAVLRDVTYERLLKRLRRNYHLQVAGWLSEHSGDRGEEYAGRIGEHYERGGNLDQAIEWYYKAGKQAQQTFAPEMAKEYYQKALAISEDLSELTEELRALRIELYFGLGQVLDWLGQYTEAIGVYRRLVRAAEDLDNLVMQARAWHGISEVQMHRGEARSSIESAMKEEKVARSAGADLELTKALWMQAWGAFRLGEMETAFSLAEQVSKLSKQIEDQSQLGQSLNLLGILEWASGHFPKATEYYQQALDIFRALGNRRRIMLTVNNLGVLSQARGDYEEAYRQYQEAFDSAHEIGNRDGEMVYLSNLGGIKVQLGDYPSAEADLLRVIDMAGTGGLDVLSANYSFLAEAYLGQDKLPLALSAAKQSLSLAEEMEFTQELGMAWRVLGKVIASLGKPIQVERRQEKETGTHDADACFAESERIFRTNEREDELAVTLREWAKHKFNQGDQVEWTRLWKEAKAIFARLGAQPEIDRMEDFYEKQVER
jgi:predicted ATPase/class 3 adenylate cyclase